MFKRIILSIILIVACQAVFSQEKTAVDYRADRTQFTKLNDTSIVKLIGNVFIFHNGAIISCDTAYRYSERRFEAFGKVIINQDSLYIYGDKVIYNGESEIAQVYSQLIKVVDSSAVMYTRTMYFNTREKIGYFSNGATLQQGNNLLESESGTYNTQSKIVTLNNRVAMENDEYVLKTKSLIYDQNIEKTFFNTLTNIWNIKGEYLQADKGNYDRMKTIYNFEKNSYILTKEQECWSDSLIYFSGANEVELKSNIQIDDTTQRASTFGDYGYFWNKSKNVLMTKQPSMFSYSEDSRDSSFVRADTITVRPILERLNTFEQSDNIMGPMGVLDSLMGTGVAKIATRDSLMLDKHQRDSLSQLAKENIKTLEISDNLIDSIKNLQSKPIEVVEDSVKRDVVRDAVPTYKELYTEEQLSKMAGKELRKAKVLMKRDRKRFDRELRRLINDDKKLEILAKEQAQKDSLEAAKNIMKDSLSDELKEILEIKNIPDSSDMIVRAMGDAKIYKFDMQSIADTIIVESVDSTTTSLGSPVAWNGANQITAGRIRSYILNGEITRTRMFSDPIIAQMVELGKYNQMKGDNMDALYRNSEIYKLVVTGNSQSRFYQVEMDKENNEQYIVAFITSKAKNMIIDMDSSVIKRIKWIDGTEAFTYPLELIPEDAKIVEGFKWVIELRPQKDEVFNRMIRPSERAAKMLIKKPDFQITKEIMEQRAKLLKEGVWTDRNDKLKIDRNELVKQSLEKR